MLFSYFCQLRRLVFDQSSLVQPVSEYRGGPLSMTDGGEGQTMEILVSNIGYILFPSSIVSRLSGVF